MANANCTGSCPATEIIEDLRSAIAGAAGLLVAGAAADDLVCARNLLMQARERCGTLREIVRHD